MINILFQPRPLHSDEGAMSYYIFFRPIHEADTISVSANMGGFTPMHQAVSGIEPKRDDISPVVQTRTLSSTITSDRKETSDRRRNDESTLHQPELKIKSYVVIL